MRCFLCGNKVKKKHFCFGCRVMICDDCDDPNGDLPPGGHSHGPLDHLRCGSCGGQPRQAKDLPRWHKNLTSHIARLLEAE
jgi:hypothetical protein